MDDTTARSPSKTVLIAIKENRIMKIIAAIARESGTPLSLENVTLGEPRETEVVVDVVATGVCHTDLVVQEGLLPTPMPVVLGHEGAGIVRSVGNKVSKVKPGDHVVMTFDSCGHCPSCSEKAPSYCHAFFPKNFSACREDGSTAIQNEQGGNIHSHFFGQSSFASSAICSESNVVKVNPNVPLKMLGPLACGFQTGAGAIVNALNVKPGSSVVIFGTGSVGLAAIMAAKISQASTIIAIDRHATRLSLAKELGATHVIEAKGQNVAEDIIAITEYGCQFALDTTGVPAVIRQAVESLAPRGTCGILGASGPEAELTFNETHFMSGGRRLMGIVEGEALPDTFIPQMIQWYLDGQFPIDKLITYYPYEEINNAIADTASGATIKPIVVWRD